MTFVEVEGDKGKDRMTLVRIERSIRKMKEIRINKIGLLLRLKEIKINKIELLLRLKEIRDRIE